MHLSSDNLPRSNFTVWCRFDCCCSVIRREGLRITNKNIGFKDIMIKEYAIFLMVDKLRLCEYKKSDTSAFTNDTSFCFGAFLMLPTFTFSNYASVCCYSGAFLS